MLIPAFVLLIGLILAFANGANDNFKGVATIYGSRIAGYRTALIWATVTTLAGAVLSVFIIEGLIKAFSGKGLVAPEAMALGRFPAVVALAAGLTVLLASRLGMPISTTHSLVGALSGVAIVTSSGWGWLPLLGLVFFLPLLTSPLVSLLLSWVANRLAPAPAAACICIAGAETSGGGGSLPVLITGSESECAIHGASPVVKTSWLVNSLHFLSAGAVGFARGLNDTPKLLGIVVAGGLFTADASLALIVGLAMALGGILWSRPIAKTMGEKLTPMSPGQGTIANALTSAIVGAASGLSLPVSTTHVACGTIFGLGAARKELSRKWALAIAGSWAFTLPLAAALASALWFGLSFMG